MSGIIPSLWYNMIEDKEYRNRRVKPRKEKKMTRKDRDFQDALAAYGSTYDNKKYCDVTRGMAVNTVNQLVDDCLARCGSPYHTESGRAWGKKTRAYLERFGR